jgi:hypothetical protein
VEAVHAAPATELARQAAACDNGVVDLSDLRHGRARLARLERDEQAAASFAVVAALRPLAELGGDTVAPADLVRLLDEAQAAMRRASADALQQLLAAAETMPVLASGEEPSGNAAFALDVLACLIYAIKTMTEPEPALWSGYCVQRAYDCLFVADEALGRSGSPARLMQALDAWLEGDGGELMRRESASVAALPGQLRQLS